MSAMIWSFLVGLASFGLILVVLWDGFETIVLPRRVSRQFRLARAFYRATWRPWASLAERNPVPSREGLLSLYGPLAQFLLLAVWAAGLVVGFGGLQWALGSQLHPSQGDLGLATDLYMSGTTFFTLGLGDVTPASEAARFVTVVEAGVGFGFLAMVISYLPVIYQAFSRREVEISMLDARAGSPPTAVELLRRQLNGHSLGSMEPFLLSWERWSAELLESHMSYPAIAYFRSQHENQSWLAALTAVLDGCALAIVGVDGIPVGPARLAFAMARHAAVDLAQVFNTPPVDPETDRLPPEMLVRLRAILEDSGAPLREGADADRKLRDLRHMYEPHVNALSLYLLMPLPTWMPVGKSVDAWKTSAWEHEGDGGFIGLDDRSS